MSTGCPQFEGGLFAERNAICTAISRAGAEERIAQALPFIKEVVLSDTYYDTNQFAITTRDWWLRCRNGAWELKLVLLSSSSILLPSSCCPLRAAIFLFRQLTVPFAPLVAASDFRWIAHWLGYLRRGTP